MTQSLLWPIRPSPGHPTQMFGFVFRSFPPRSFYYSHISFIPSVSMYQVPSCTSHCIWRKQQWGKFLPHGVYTCHLFFFMCIKAHSLYLVFSLPGQYFSCIAWFLLQVFAQMSSCCKILTTQHMIAMFIFSRMYPSWGQRPCLVCSPWCVLSWWHSLIHVRKYPINILLNIEWMKQSEKWPDIEGKNSAAVWNIFSSVTFFFYNFEVINISVIKFIFVS